MPDSMLLEYLTEAQKHGGKLIIRGLKNGDFKQTLKALTMSTGEILKLDINPFPFREFKITQVPTIVLSDGTSYDKMTGSVSLKHALETFKSSGDVKTYVTEVSSNRDVKTYTREVNIK